jgi:hypothetical protein
MTGSSSYGFYLTISGGRWLMVRAGREQPTVRPHERGGGAGDPPPRGILELLRSLVDHSWVC